MRFTTLIPRSSQLPPLPSPTQRHHFPSDSISDEFAEFSTGISQTASDIMFADSSSAEAAEMPTPWPGSIADQASLNAESLAAKIEKVSAVSRKETRPSNCVVKRRASNYRRPKNEHISCHEAKTLQSQDELKLVLLRPPSKLSVPRLSYAHLTHRFVLRRHYPRPSSPQHRVAATPPPCVQTPPW